MYQKKDYELRIAPLLWGGMFRMSLSLEKWFRALGFLWEAFDVPLENLYSIIDFM